MGLEWQQLRAQAARLLEWLSLCDCWNGWFSSGRDAERGYRLDSGRVRNRAHAGLMSHRATSGLSSPYGGRPTVVFRRTGG